VHGATSTKTKSRACPNWTPAPSTHAHFATGRRRTRGGEQRNPEHSRTPLGRREWAAQQGGTGPLAASPRYHSPGCWRAAGTPQRERFAHGEGSGHTQIARIRCIGASAITPPPPRRRRRRRRLRRLIPPPTTAARRLRGAANRGSWPWLLTPRLSVEGPTR
jgi:hypothetical protein